MDLILRNARVLGSEGAATDIGIDKGRIAAIQPDLAATGETLDLGGRLVAPGLIETHIHLDKSRILGRCKAEKGDLEEAIGEVAKQKKSFTPEDVYARAKATLERAILNGTTHMRTHLEVDPGIGLRGLEGVRPLIDEYKWAIDLEICIFPQEGLLNNPGTDELMVEALKTRRQGGRRRALHRLEPARPDRPHLRHRPRVRHRHRHAPRLRAEPGRSRPRSTSASSPSASSGAGASPSATSPSSRPPLPISSPSAPSAWRTPALPSPCSPRPTST